MRVVSPPKEITRKKKEVWVNKPRVHLGNKVTEKDVVGVLEMEEDSLYLWGGGKLY